VIKRRKLNKKKKPEKKNRLFPCYKIPIQKNFLFETGLKIISKPFSSFLLSLL
jgi:CRISPR/Cas system CSM-associated protein Csm5 (group 7 of RAMP superfamily)